MKKLIVLLAGLLFLVGCNGNEYLGGHVTYEDGTPLTIGKVVFATDTFQASGDLDDKGKYVMGSVTVKDGLPKGKYRVYIDGANEEVAGKNGMSLRSLIDPKFNNYTSTPLTCEVPAPKNTFDISVPPNPTPK